MRSRLLLYGLALLAAIAPFAPASRDLVLYNHSPSMPVGFYLRAEGEITRGAIVTVRARDVAPSEAKARGFDGPRDRFLKRVAALGGDLVCSDGGKLRINGVIAATRTDASAPLLWRGCRTLSENEILLLGDSADSFDGRYWGPIARDEVEGLWRRAHFAPRAS